LIFFISFLLIVIEILIKHLHRLLGAPVVEWSRHWSHTTRPLTSSPHRFESCTDQCDFVKKFVILLAESRWSFPKYITEKLLNMAKNGNKHRLLKLQYQSLCCNIFHVNFYNCKKMSKYDETDLLLRCIDILDELHLRCGKR
jgi:hypothetical protein